MTKRPRIIIFFLIIFLAAFLRLYKVTTVPPHLYWDEASIAYNAYSINLTGKDEWGNADPLLFKSFGDYKLPLYIYLTAVSQKFFGLTDLSVRVPSVFAGIATVAVMFFLVKEQILLIREKYKQFAFINSSGLIAATAAFFLAISPWALQFSRGGFEANVALFFRASGSWLFLLSLRKKNYWILYPALLFFAASMYTYHSATITAPLILGMFVLLFYRRLIANWRVVLPAFLLMIIVITPYVPAYLLSAQGRTRFTQEEFTHMPGNPVTNFVNNYVANFSLDYLFFHGDQDGRHSVKKLGELYLWQLPTILAGAYFLLRYRSKASVIVFGWILIGSLPPALTVVSPHALRGLLAVRSWETLSAIGFIYILFKVKPYLRYLSIPIICFAFLVYLKLYYFNYPAAYAADWQDGQRQAVLFVKKIANDYQKIYVYKTLEPIYIQLYWPIDPKVLQTSNHNLQKMDKWQYFDFDNFPVKINPLEKDLIVMPIWAQPDPAWTILRQIKNAGQEPIFNIYDF